MAQEVLAGSAVADIERTIGTLQAKVEGLQEDITELRSELREVSALLHQARGGWRILASLLGVALTLGGLAMAWWKAR